MTRPYPYTVQRVRHLGRPGDFHFQFDIMGAAQFEHGSRARAASSLLSTPDLAVQPISVTMIPNIYVQGVSGVGSLRATPRTVQGYYLGSPLGGAQAAVMLLTELGLIERSDGHVTREPVYVQEAWATPLPEIEAWWCLDGFFPETQPNAHSWVLFRNRLVANDFLWALQNGSLPL